MMLSGDDIPNLILVFPLTSLAHYVTAFAKLTSLAVSILQIKYHRVFAIVRLASR